MGSPTEFGWLSTENVTSFRQATEICYGIPLRLKKPRAFACLLALNSQKFDSAQDDRMTGCFIIGAIFCFTKEYARAILHGRVLFILQFLLYSFSLPLSHRESRLQTPIL